MKNIVSIILSSLFIVSCIGIKKANESFISVCKTSNDTIRIDYLDSSHSIVSVDREIKNDTLDLEVYVGIFRPNKIYQTGLEKTIGFINIGSKTYRLDEMNICPKIYKGEEGLEYLKSLKTD